MTYSEQQLLPILLSILIFSLVELVVIFYRFELVKQLFEKESARLRSVLGLVLLTHVLVYLLPVICLSNLLASSWLLILGLGDHWSSILASSTLINAFLLALEFTKSF